MTTKPKRKRGRPAHATEEAVLGAALAAFAEFGYEGTSVRALNKQLGLSHNSVQQRFGNKEQLWYRAVDHGFGALVKEMLAGEAAAGGDTGGGDDSDSDAARAEDQDDGDAATEAEAEEAPHVDELEVLYERLLRFVEISVEHPLLLRLMNHEGVRPGPRLDHVFDTYTKPALTPLREHLDRLHAEGRIRPVTLRTLFMMITHGAVAPYTIVGFSDRFDEIDGPFDPKSHAETATRILVAGLVIDDDEPS